LVAWIEVRALRSAYMRIGLGPHAAVLLLLASLGGSYLNIPVARLSAHHIISGQEVAFFGMHYVIPVVVDWPGTIIAVNVGGAVIPGVLSFYLLIRNELWIRGLLATAGVTVVCHILAQPVAGVGIALPIFVPPASAAIVALLLSRRYAAPLAYIGGSMGTLIGADLLNLDKVQGLGAPVASIGGAGTFDGIFLTSILAVLLASMFSQPVRRRMGTMQSFYQQSPFLLQVGGRQSRSRKSPRSVLRNSSIVISRAIFQLSDLLHDLARSFNN
jgi:uncharacterized membrane protein